MLNIGLNGSKSLVITIDIPHSRGLTYSCLEKKNGCREPDHWHWWQISGSRGESKGYPSSKSLSGIIVPIWWMWTQFAGSCQCSCTGFVSSKGKISGLQFRSVEMLLWESGGLCEGVSVTGAGNFQSFILIEDLLALENQLSDTRALKWF